MNAVVSPTLFQRIQGTLGLTHLDSDYDLYRQVETRLPIQVLESLKTYGLTTQEVHSLIIPQRTLAHRRQKGEKLSEDESDRVMRVARLLGLAEDTFGKRDKALHWLRKPQEGRLEGNSPLELLRTSTGGHLVEQMLGQIQYGIFA
jgi:putative toxin-antitoxin system antitoxin component (TIGR02293 family)